MRQVIGPDPLTAQPVAGQPTIETNVGTLDYEAVMNNRVGGQGVVHVHSQLRPRRSQVGPAEPPALDLLLPSTAAIGAPSFTLHVYGSGFDEESVIVFAGQDENTTFVSESEVTTGVNMDVWLGADPAIAVLVKNPDDQRSNVLNFSFTAGKRR